MFPYLRMRQQQPPQSKPCFRSAPKYSRDTICELRESKMIDYEGQIKLKVHGTTQWVWVDVRAQSVMFARAGSVDSDPNAVCRAGPALPPPATVMIACLAAPTRAVVTAG